MWISPKMEKSRVTCCFRKILNPCFKKSPVGGNGLDLVLAGDDIQYTTYVQYAYDFITV